MIPPSARHGFEAGHGLESRHGLEARHVLAAPVVDLGDVAFRLTASDERRADAVASLFRYAPDSQSAPRCALHFGAVAVACPESPPDASIGGLDVWRDGSGRLVIRGPDGVSARSSAQEIEVGGGAVALARAFRNVCLLALTHCFAAHGRHLLHAGSVVVDDRAVAVLGTTGSGKSTLAGAAVRLGWPVLSDDLLMVRRLMVRRAGPAIVARGLPRPISLPRDVLAAPVVGGRPVPDDPRGRHELPASTLAGATHPVGGVVVVEPGTGERSALTTISGLDVFGHALRASTSLADPGLRPEILAIAAALARAPAWRLARGTDPRTALGDVASQLEEIRRQLRERRAPTTSRATSPHAPPKR
jgi:hypothetical protein